jgi:hypothetical protein
MSAITNIFRRGAVYYYRRRVRWPDDARSSICMSLRIGPQIIVLFSRSTRQHKG